MALNCNWMTDAEIRRHAERNNPSLKIVSQHRTWAVTEYGMECLTENYDIEASALFTHDWDRQLRKKLWTVAVDVIGCLAEAKQYHANLARD